MCSFIGSIFRTTWWFTTIKWPSTKTGTLTIEWVFLQTFFIICTIFSIFLQFFQLFYNFFNFFTIFSTFFTIFSTFLQFVQFFYNFFNFFTNVFFTIFTNFFYIFFNFLFWKLLLRWIISTLYGRLFVGIWPFDSNLKLKRRLLQIR